jgi:hypothetical protein
MRTSPQSLLAGPEPLGGRAFQQVPGDLRRVLEVIRAQQGDPARVLRALNRGLECPLEGDKPDEGKGREENQAEPEEGRPKLLAVATRPRATRPPETAARNMFARPVDSAMVEARAPSRAREGDLSSPGRRELGAKSGAKSKRRRKRKRRTRSMKD